LGGGSYKKKKPGALPKRATEKIKGAFARKPKTRALEKLVGKTTAGSRRAGEHGSPKKGSTQKNWGRGRGEKQKKGVTQLGEMATVES